MTSVPMTLPAPVATPPAAPTSAGATGLGQAAAAADPTSPKGDSAAPAAPPEFAALLAKLVAPIVAEVAASSVPTPVAPEVPVAEPSKDLDATVLSLAMAASGLVVTPPPPVPVPVPVPMATSDVAPTATAAPGAVNGLLAPAAPATTEAAATVEPQAPTRGIHDDAPAPTAASAPEASSGVAHRPAAQATDGATPTPRDPRPELDLAAATTPTATGSAPTPAPQAPEARAATVVDTTPAAPPLATTQPVVRTEASRGAEVRPPVPPHAQVVEVVAPLLRRPDGSHQVTLRLHPEDLGSVEIRVELRGGEVHLHLSADSAAGREALRGSLPALRAELESHGVRAGTLDLGDRSPGQTPGRQAPATRFDLPVDEADGPFTVPVPTHEPAADAAVDVRL